MIKPLMDYVLIRKEKGKEVDAGVYIPAGEDNSIVKGTVLDYGSEIENLKLAKNDVVYFKRWSASDIKDYVLVKSEDVIAKEING